MRTQLALILMKLNYFLGNGSPIDSVHLEREKSILSY